MPGDFHIFWLPGMDVGHAGFHLTRKGLKGFIIKGFQLIGDFIEYEGDVIKISLL